MITAPDYFSSIFKKKDIAEEINTTMITTDKNDGAVEFDSAYSNYMLSLNWGYDSQADLINTYRDISNFSMVDYAIEDIVNECVSFLDDEDPIAMDLTDIEDETLSESMKDKFYDAWEKISSLLELNETIHRRMRNFYVDGRVAYQKVYDKNNLKDGLQNIVELDTKFITKVRDVHYNDTTKTIDRINEKYIYNENLNNKGTDKKTDQKRSKTDRAFSLDPRHITYVTSGLVDNTTGYAVSWLHKAVKPANQLRMMENSLVIYRITRAPERRIFYVDTSGMQNSKATQFLNNLKNSYRNRMSFNPESGTFKDQKHLMTMQEDFWLPRNSNGRATEVDTLSGGENLDQIADILYFQKELYKSLNIPISRLDPESTVSFGRQTEVSRDELKLSKLVSKIRKRFNLIFLDLLETELIQTRIIKPNEWDKVKQKIKFKYAQDLYLEELKKFEMVAGRIELANSIEPYVGKYFSHKYVREEIFQQSELEVGEQDKQIKKEMKDPKYNVEEE